MSVAVIIPAYNCESTIEKAIQSAIAQSVSSTEIIVVDDGSTDGTPEILKRYADSVKVLRQPNAGAAAARNAGVAATSGEYLAFLDADDAWLPGRLSRTLAALEVNSQAVLSFCDYTVVKKSAEVVALSVAGRAPSHRDLLQRGWPIIPSAATIRRSEFERVGGFCEEFTGCGGEDPYLWLLLSERGEFEYIPDRLVLYLGSTAATTFTKWRLGVTTLRRLVKARYGNAGDGHLRQTEEYLARLALAGALEELKRQYVLRAAVLVYYTTMWRPGLLFEKEFLAKIFRARNLRQLAKLLFRSPIRVAS